MNFEDIKEKSMNLFMKFSALILLLFMIIIFGSVIISLPAVVKNFLALLPKIYTFTLQNFVSSTANIIEFVLFDVILILLANGINEIFLKSIMAGGGEKNLSLEKKLIDFISYLSRPFLMTVASILIVSVFEIIVEMYGDISQMRFLAEEDLNRYFYSRLLLILFVFITIIMISLLIYIEKVVAHPIESQNTSSESVKHK